MNQQAIAIIGLLIWVVLTGLLPGLFGLTAGTVWLMRIGLWLLGGIAAGWLIWRSRKRVTGVAQAGQRPGEDLDFLIRETRRKLGSKKFGRRPSLSGYPLLFVAGPPQSGKTTTVLNSSLDLELLSGLVNQGRLVASTETANFWLCRSTLVVEAGTKIWGDANAWTQFCRRFDAAIPSAKFAPRAALVCVSVEDLLRPGGAEETSASARLLNDRLNTLANTLGVRLPVYVVFTKSNRLKYFEEFAANFTNDEALGVFGATLPIVSPEAGQGYFDFEGRRLDEAFEKLFGAFSDARFILLERETNQAQLPAIYQFPREFRKLRESIVRFLLELGKPKQTQVSPYLRGFYFTGVRPVPVTDPDGQARRVPQWVFVPRFFREVLMADRVALPVGGLNRKAMLLRRFVLAAATTVAMAMAGGWTISYFNNRALVLQALESSRAVGALRGGSALNCATLASTDALQKLEVLRAVLQDLRAGVLYRPLMMQRWGLSVHDRLYPKLRSIYFGALLEILVSGTKDSLVDYLDRLPARPDLSEEYSRPYNALRAYLIVTSNPEKSDVSISPVLQEFWHGSCPVDDSRKALVARQMDLYADELKAYAPTSRANDAAIAHARAYLNGMTGQERVYRTLLGEANRTAPSILFGRIYPGAEVAVTNRKEIAGAFTKEGWAIVQSSLRNVRKLFEGEAWVLGPGAAREIDFSSMEPQLRRRYTAEYLDAWKDFLVQTKVRPYASITDASDKLRMFAEPRSPLLAAFYLASKHTAVEDDALRSAFRVVQTVVDPKSENYRWIGDTNKPYMIALGHLQVQVDQLAHLPESMRDPVAAASVAAAATGKGAAVTIVQQEGSDTAGIADLVVNLMEAPITAVEPVIRNLNTVAVNGAAAQFCSKPLWGRYPFGSTGKQMSAREFLAFFQRPDGELWQFYQESLMRMLTEQNGVFHRNTVPGMAVRPQFAVWFNRMAAVSKALTPQFTFTVQAHEGEGLRTVRLMIGGQGGPITNAPRQFTWPGESGRGVEWTLEDSPTPQPYAGDWGVFDWFRDAEWSARSATSHTVTWTQMLGGRPRQGPDGRPLKARLDVNMPVPLFRSGYLREVGCQSKVAQPGN
jgi:type VI secretion system protein ImpL